MPTKPTRKAGRQRRSLKDFPQDRSGCGLERVAEITGKSYGEVREAWVTHCNGDPKHLAAVGNGAGLRAYEVAKLLDIFGRGDIALAVMNAPAVILLVDKHNFGHYVFLNDEGKLIGYDL
jgi:hypothetical protein